LKNIPVKNSLLIILLLIIFTGCGFKGNPAPYPVIADRKPLIHNMEALASGETIVLKWDFQDKKGLISYIGIEKSEVGTPGNECKNCPRSYARIGQISVKTGMVADNGQGALNFTDTKVVKGKIYNYRLMLCEENGNCSEASMAEINFK
jgi:hypothetical protein